MHDELIHVAYWRYHLWARRAFTTGCHTFNLHMLARAGAVAAVFARESGATVRLETSQEGTNEAGTGALPAVYGNAQESPKEIPPISHAP